MRVLRPFRWVRLSSGDDRNDVLFFKVTVSDDQDVQLDTHTEEEKAFLRVRMIWIGNYPGKVIKECCLGFVEGYAVLLLVRRILCRISIEADIVHAYSVLTMYVSSSLTSNE